MSMKYSYLHYDNISQQQRMNMKYTYLHYDNTKIITHIKKTLSPATIDSTC